MKHFLILLAFFLLISTAKAREVTYGVGTACDYDASNVALQDVIDDGEIMVIRITNQTIHKVNLDIDRRISLFGGYATCEDADDNTLSIGKSILSGENMGAVINVKFLSGDGFSPIVVLNNLIIMNGSNSGVRIDNSDYHSYVVIENSIVTANTNSSEGGGVYLSGRSGSHGGTPELRIIHSLVVENSSENGGGLFCNNARVNVTDGSKISNNSASFQFDYRGHGGGIFATNECDIKVRSERYYNDPEDLHAGIIENTATGHGGGIYVNGSSQVTFDSAVDGSLRQGEVQLNHNVADADENGFGDGGGIYVTGLSSNIGMNGLYLEHNSAVNGGGMALFDSANIYTSQNHCGRKSSCNKFADNKTSTNNGKGGAVYMNGAGGSFLFTEVSGNRADEGTALYATNYSEVGFYNSFMYYNGNQGLQSYSDKYLFAVHDSKLKLHNITSSLNLVTFATVGGSNSEYLIANSIVYEPVPGQTANLMNSQGEFNCVVLENELGVQHSTNTLVGVNPMFKDLAHGDFHLQANSPAIDLCFYDTSRIPVQTARQTGGDNIAEAFTDFDGEYRVWDDPTVINQFGAVDAGADESYEGDVIFKSNF